MRHLRKALHLLVTGLLLCSAGAALADLPPFKTPAAPIECPADTALEHAICSDDSLMSDLRESELMYLLAAKDSPLLAAAARGDWHSEYSGCTSLAPYQGLLSVCIKGTFTRFANALQRKREPSLWDDRDTLFNEITSRLDKDYQETKMERGKCLVGAALELDDGKEPVLAIARRVSSRCERHAALLVRTLLIRNGLERPFVQRTTPITRQQVAALSPTLGKPPDAIAIIELLRRGGASR